MIENLPQLEEFFLAHAAMVDGGLEAALSADGGRRPFAVLWEGMRHGAGLGPAGGGKRVRPMLCLLTARCLDCPAEPALPFALAMELMHSFALVHDDIEDGDEWRRGQPAVWKRFGLAHGINIGDGLLTRAFAVIARSALDPALRADLTLLLAETLEATIEGQALDIEARNSRHLSIEDYLDLVTRKTGRYLAAPLVGGALVARAPSQTVERLAALGPILGPLFQILDDLIDLSHGKGRDAIGNDLREGKRSYLVAHLLTNGDHASKNRLLGILDTPRETTTADMVAEGVEMFEAAGSFAAARAEAERLRLEARSAIAGLEPAALARSLQVVMDYLADRVS